MKSKILSPIFVLFSFFACTIANTSSVEIDNNDLIGSWSVKNLNLDNATLSVTSPVVTTLAANGIGKNFNTTISFSENPNNVTLNGNFVLELTYREPSGIEQTEELTLNNIFFNDNFGFTSSTWILNDDELQLNEGGEMLPIRIIDFVNNLLTIETNVDKTITVNGVTSTVVGKAFIQLEKI
jgi:hypothetical protein